ncbi:unnamed protein product [Cuscuta campestris]|uniref:Uncharacterized protein n=1 Tax=Cuscuta campestris TaxID=132261 RepID=A0A484KQ31_9ASTE|nr:unnamed protein product [Cuscuta campestris]
MDFSGDEEQCSALALRLFYSEHDGNCSAEDLEWADSCLSPNHELSTGGLDLFRNSFASLGIHQGSKQESSMDENGEFCPADDRNMFVHSGKGRGSPLLRLITASDDLTNEQDMGNRIDYDPSSVTTDTPNSKFNLENVFLPTYNENQRAIVTADPELDSIFPAFFMEDQPADNIFKVWEIDIPDEEDELIGHVKKALAECSSEPEGSVPEGSEMSVGLNDRFLDDLILRFDDMSLSW